MKIVIVLFTILSIQVIAFSGTIYVPGDYPTIQEAIDASVGCDTILVSQGTYSENIDFKGKAITVKSEYGPEATVIDGNQAGKVVTFQNGEGLDSVLEGFTISNGLGLAWGYGCGIHCQQASPTIKNNIITGNIGQIWTSGGGICCYEASPTIINNTISGNEVAGWWGFGEGGGIFCYNSSAKIINNTITGNTTSDPSTPAEGGGICCKGIGVIIISCNTISDNYAGYGGGIYCEVIGDITISCNTISDNYAGYGGGICCWSPDSLPTITNNTISGNEANEGGGICCYKSSPTVTNNTIFGNQSHSSGGGIYCYYTSSSIITNTIIWNNEAPTGKEISIMGSTSFPSILTISYSDVKGGQASIYVDPYCTLNWGPGIIDADPLFVQGPNGFNYISQVVAGQLVDSPCVDKGGDLASNLGMDIYWTRTDEVPDSDIVDMGFHYGPFTFPKLQTDTIKITESVGGTANFLLLAGPDNANRNYILLGGVTGTAPGTPLPGGKATLPINWDVFTHFLMAYLNTPIFQNFMGTLDAVGTASSTFDTQGPVPGIAGITISFAYALNNPWNFASNPVAIEIVF